MRKGVHAVGDVTNADGDLREDTVSKIPKSYQMVYPEGLGDLLERAYVEEGGGFSFSTPAVH